MKCEICGKGIFDGIPNNQFIRQNEKGVAGIWRCENCNFLPLDPETQVIVECLNKK